MNAQEDATENLRTFTSFLDDLIHDFESNVSHLAECQIELRMKQDSIKTLNNMSWSDSISQSLGAVSDAIDEETSKVAELWSEHERLKESMTDSLRFVDLWSKTLRGYSQKINMILSKGPESEKPSTSPNTMLLGNLVR